MPRPKLRRPVYRLKLRGRIWSLTWTDPESGATRSISTGQDELAQAAVWRDQWLAGQEQPLPPSQPLVSAILTGYLAERRGKVEAHDRLQYASMAINRHVGNLEPHMLTPTMYGERRAGEGVSSGTVRREIATLRAALKWASQQQPPWIDRAPYVEMPSKAPPRDRWLTRAEFDRLRDACILPHVRLFVLLAYHTAARRGAILELTWDRVDLDARRIAYAKPGRRETKKRRATVPINAALFDELQQARRMALTEHVIEFRGRPVMSIRKGFEESCRRAGIAGCTPHTIRHTAASHMVMAGVPLAQVARMLGDTEEMVEKVYGKWSPDYLRDAADALAGDVGPRLVSTEAR